MNRIITMLLPCLLSIPFANAGMQAMDDNELSSTYGQAIFEVKEEVVRQASGGDLTMLRLTIGARIELNANIDELALGRYWRPEGTNCTGGPGGDKVCYNNIIPVGYNDNIDWACTAKPCGSIGLYDANYTSSGLTHSVGEKSFFDESVFPGGYQPDGGIDIKLRNVTFGQIRNENGVYSMLPFIQENPYLEFAFDDNGSARKLVGFRVGAEESWGYQGNIIDVISGYIRPTITVDAKLFGAIYVGTISLDAFLGGVRTIGWLDTKTLDLKSVTGLASLLISNPDSLLEQSAHAQLFPVQSNYLDHSNSFFISMGSRSVQWSAVNGFSSEITSPGFWISMGGDSGLIAKTQEGHHPNNYFPGHPLHALYGGNTNYGTPANLPKWSQTY